MSARSTNDLKKCKTIDEYCHILTHVAHCLYNMYECMYIYIHIERNIWALKFTSSHLGVLQRLFLEELEVGLKSTKQLQTYLGHVVYMPQLLHTTDCTYIWSRLPSPSHNSMRTDELICTVVSVARLKLYFLSSKSQVVLTD